jgi:hypothetical protein
MLYVFGAMLARPISLIRRTMLDLGAGDFDQRISVERNDEIGELFQSFNTMAKEVQNIFVKRGYEMDKKSAAETAAADELSERTSIGIASRLSKSKASGRNSDAPGLLSGQTIETVKVISAEKLEDSLEFLKRVVTQPGPAIGSAVEGLREVLASAAAKRRPSRSDVAEPSPPVGASQSSPADEDATIITKAPLQGSEESDRENSGENLDLDEADHATPQDLDSTVVASRMQKD